MKFTETVLKGSYVIDLEPITDERGWFVRTFCKDEFIIPSDAVIYPERHSRTTCEHDYLLKKK